MTTIGRPSNLQGAAIPLRRRDLRSPTKSRQLLVDTGDDRYWTFFKGVPAISNYVQVLSNSADLVSYYPGLIDPEASEPVPVEDGPVFDVWEEIGGETAVSEWVSSLVVHLSVPGQGWFVPIVKPDVLARLEDIAEGEEVPVTWQVVSTADLKRLLKINPTDSIPEDDNRIWRIYDPDPQNSKNPTSSVRRAATQAQILMLIDRRAETDLYSRIHAGVWPLPSSLKSQTTPSGKLWADILEEGLIMAAEPGALESRVPLMAFMEIGEIAAIKPPIKLSVDDGEWLLKLEEKTLRQLAIGLDAPIELTTGIGGLNHWSAWLIQEATYTQHLDPLIVRILRSLDPWWRAQLEARRIPNVEDYVIWRNPATAINRPDSFQESMQLYDRFVISDNELRAAADKGDESAPDEAEIQRRIAIQLAVKAQAAPTGSDRSIPDTKPVQAATTPSLDRLARRLAQIDAATLARLEREAAQQVRNKREALLAAIAAAALARGLEVGDPDTLPQRLGKDVVTNLLPGNLAEPDDFNPTPFTAILLDGQAETGTITHPYGISRDTDADDEDRSTAVTLLLAALAGSVISSLFRSPDTSGELGIDGAEWVPTDALRKAMDTAGGGLAQRFGDDAWELIGNGKRTLDGMTAAGMTTEGFEWQYGTMPRRTFEPHLNLDGFQFTRWNDPGLRQTSASTWVGGEYFYPQDHRGCRCNFVRTLVAVGQESTAVA